MLLFLKDSGLMMHRVVLPLSWFINHLLIQVLKAWTHQLLTYLVGVPVVPVMNRGCELSIGWVAPTGSW